VVVAHKVDCVPNISGVGCVICNYYHIGGGECNRQLIRCQGGFVPAIKSSCTIFLP
jgi:hypothetical protein